ncbi:hypothetical protein A3I48_03680 [Candidatus Daviesbacteria bacterium RIFCSPLOWO2_02_FULL_36_7]|uniref:Uncharacterized protein n=1 Tax=Candidatus Daviesbacteria bacterium RIFCSPLOWO2_02_FULL_36_7 TaxID=1797792 RepID=A0A1F5MG79_9BACT|nr:MAG: hypothetical protein A3I48_03680 [Candidatus Daviesbacteria bacterium RIFCSPLOWO2_02_FULL_36_7]
MNRFSILRVLHLLFLGVLLAFIYFFYAVYQPLKAHNVCAKNSAESVLGINQQNNAFDLYQQTYKNCLLSF